MLHKFIDCHLISLVDDLWTCVIAASLSTAGVRDLEF